MAARRGGAWPASKRYVAFVFVKGADLAEQRQL
jgi:hypothetical protein